MTRPAPALDDAVRRLRATVAANDVSWLRMDDVAVVIEAAAAAELDRVTAFAAVFDARRWVA